MLTALALTALLAAPADLEGLLSRIINAYGGQQAVARVRVLRETGTLDTMRGTAKTVRYYAGPLRLRVDIEYPQGMGEDRVLDGKRATRNGEAVEGPMRDAMVLQAARLGLPGLLTKRKVVDLGWVERDGKKLRAVGVPLDDGMSLAIAVDPQSGLILRSEGQLSNGIRFATIYSEFRQVNGVLFAFREANWANGQHTGDTRLTQIELLDTAPEGWFK